MGTLCSVHWPARSQCARGVFCLTSNPVQPLPLFCCHCYNNNNHNHEFRNGSLIILEILWRKASTRSRLPTSTREMRPGIRTDFQSPCSPGAGFSPQRVSQGDPPSPRTTAARRAAGRSSPRPAAPCRHSRPRRPHAVNLRVFNIVIFAYNVTCCKKLILAVVQPGGLRRTLVHFQPAHGCRRHKLLATSMARACPAAWEGRRPTGPGDGGSWC